ncbi:hypothetical protein [Dactylosporangium cerinum]
MSNSRHAPGVVRSCSRIRPISAPAGISRTVTAAPAPSVTSSRKRVAPPNQSATQPPAPLLALVSHQRRSGFAPGAAATLPYLSTFRQCHSWPPPGRSTRHESTWPPLSSIRRSRMRT